MTDLHIDHERADHTIGRDNSFGTRRLAGLLANNGNTARGASRLLYPCLMFSVSNKDKMISLIFLDAALTMTSRASVHEKRNGEIGRPSLHYFELPAIIDGL